jgi:hypothetical protein
LIVSSTKPKARLDPANGNIQVTFNGLKLPEQKKNEAKPRQEAIPAGFSASMPVTFKQRSKNQALRIPRFAEDI